MWDPLAGAFPGGSGLCSPKAGGGGSGPGTNPAPGLLGGFGAEPVSGRGEQGQPHPGPSCSSRGPGSLCRSRCGSRSGTWGAPAVAGGSPVPAWAGKGPGCCCWGFLEGDRAALGSEGGWLSTAPRGGPVAWGGLRCGAVDAGEIKPEMAIIKRRPACAGAAPEMWGRALCSPQALPKTARGALGVQGCGLATLPPPLSIAHGDCKAGQRADRVSCFRGQKRRPSVLFLGLENRLMCLISGLRNRLSCVALGSGTEVQSCIFGT